MGSMDNYDCRQIFYRILRIQAPQYCTRHLIYNLVRPALYCPPRLSPKSINFH